MSAEREAERDDLGRVAERAHVTHGGTPEGWNCVAEAVLVAASNGNDSEAWVDMLVALDKQTERAERAEASLATLVELALEMVVECDAHLRDRRCGVSEMPDFVDALADLRRGIRAALEGGNCK